MVLERWTQTMSKIGFMVEARGSAYSSLAIELRGARNAPCPAMHEIIDGSVYILIRDGNGALALATGDVR